MEIIAQRNISDINSLIEALKELQDQAGDETLYPENSRGVAFNEVILAEDGGSKFIMIK